MIRLLWSIGPQSQDRLPTMCAPIQIMLHQCNLDLGGRSSIPLDCTGCDDPRDGPVEFQTRICFKFDSQSRASLPRVDIRCAHRRDIFLQPPLVLAVNAPPPSPARCLASASLSTQRVLSTSPTACFTYSRDRTSCPVWFDCYVVPTIVLRFVSLPPTFDLRRRLPRRRRRHVETRDHVAAM